jgi:ElaB/YqjD/DUF883 family membrane-anchored ribosome-binding protein
MDDKDKSLNERWAEPRDLPERGYARDEEPAARRTAEIRSDIERTRADMSETIDAIQDRLRPSTLASQAKDTVRDATVGKVKQMASSARERFSGSRDYTSGNGVVERIREHPLPAALAAASIAYIAFSGTRRPQMRRAIYGTTRGADPHVMETEISTDVDFNAGYDTRYGTAGDEGRRERVRQAAQRTRTGLQRFVNDNPLAAAGIAAAVGATIGMALPETERENELMGEARDEVVNRARDAARDTAERVQDAAQRVKDVAADAAKGVARGESTSRGE